MTVTFFKVRNISPKEVFRAMAEVTTNYTIHSGGVIARHRWNNGYVRFSHFVITTMYQLRCCHLERDDFTTVDVYRIPSNIRPLLEFEHPYFVVEKGLGNTSSYASNEFPALFFEVTNKRIQRKIARKSDTKGLRPSAFRLIQYAHNARKDGEKEWARHWLLAHKDCRVALAEKGARDGFI